MKFVLPIKLFFLVILPTSFLLSQTPDRPLSVGIVIYPGVEVLDFSGPAEVFAATEGFKPFLVAYKKEPLVSQGFITVTPQYSIEDCPPTDVLVFPGGGTGNVINEAAFIEWMRERSRTTQFMMSVCTGAGLLSEAGLLNGLEVTTWHGYIDRLQKKTPTATVLENTRFVDNGHIITTAGVSAGIDGALHLVSRVKGEAAARATARYMEYDKWDPNMGKINETPFVAAVRNQGLEKALQEHPDKKNSLQPRFYDGEMVNLANELLATQPQKSVAIFQWLADNTQPDVDFYDNMGKVMREVGKPAPAVDSRTFLDRLVEGDIDWAKRTYQETKTAFPNWQLFTEADLNRAAYRLYQNDQTSEALVVAKWITDLYPTSPNAWDTLSEAYELTDQPAAAIEASEKCLALLEASDDPRRERLEKVARERIERLAGKK